jgi:hypothetical protein
MLHAKSWIEAMKSHAVADVMSVQNPRRGDDCGAAGRGFPRRLSVAGEWQTLCGTRPFDDLGGPFADPAQRVPEFVTGIATIGEDIAQPRDTP